MLEYIEQLSNICSASGDEGKVRSYIASVIKPYVDELYTDTIGNLYAVKHGGERKIMLDAHMDEVGVVITDYRDDGTLDYTAHLSIDPRLALGKTLAVGPNELPGVFRLKHEYRNPAEGEYLGHDKLCIDVGSSSREETEKVVSLGDYACFNTKWRRMGENMMAGKAFDDRIGCAIMMELLKNDYPCDLYAVFSVQEETGGDGAVTGGYNITADECISVDVSFANAPDMPSKKCGKLGKGSMIGVAPVLDYAMSVKLQSIANEKDIPYQLELIGDSTGTNADHIAVSKGGVKTALVSIPQRNMHTGVEIIDVKDVESSARLIAEYVLGGGLDA